MAIAEVGESTTPTRRRLQRILVANRGEIAVRIFQACSELGRQTVAIYSEADLLAAHRYKADEAYLVGRGLGPRDAYLSIDSIIQIARRHQVDAIHPGYGFLAENATFARQVEEAGIVFIGPRPEHLDLFGDKARARQAAVDAGLPVSPGTDGPVASADEALAFAREHGYPVMVKAISGGGGRGMRLVHDDQALSAALEAAGREAASSFANAELYLEKAISTPRHIEVQILGDHHGTLIHLGERDCSIQRRHQKVVEMAPAVSLPLELRERICADAVRLMRGVGYVNAGTVEFLVDPAGHHHFIEVNPRIQVEHTVTEMVMGVDLVETQIRIAEGESLAERGLDRPPQARGCAIQCRVTTEDPARGFVPDTGRILAFRSGGGFGVRLDIGNGFVGAEISPHYDSLLVKVSTWGADFDQARRKMVRTLREVRVRGVTTNIPFLESLMEHDDFRQGRATTDFIDRHPELTAAPLRRDRGTKLLRYIAEIVVNPPSKAPRVAGPPYKPIYQPPPEGAPRPRTAKQVLDEEGARGLATWVLAQPHLLLTDTSMRDAHQSLLATRVRLHDLLGAADLIHRCAPELFSVECWGGATFDAGLRFLKEDPWDRLASIRRHLPDHLLQMLLRGQSLVGYRGYADNVVRTFVDATAAAGLDVFRIFDSLNYLPNMEVAIDAVITVDKVAEVAMCYTGDVLDRDSHYNLAYYLDLARRIEKTGAHILAIKDMAGLLKPEAARVLISALKQEVSIPIHLHTHDSAGTGVATVLAAAAAGVDIADGAIDTMAGGTSQASLSAILAGLEANPRAGALTLKKLLPMAEYWGWARRMYSAYESGPVVPDGSVYLHQMPGGQYTNLKQQAEAVGLGDRWSDVVAAYEAVDKLLGELVKVTPSSKSVGDFALFMVQNNLDVATLSEKAPSLDFPQSVIDLMSGLLGQPPRPFPAKLQRAILKGREPMSQRPGAYLPAEDLEAKTAEMATLADRPVGVRDALTSVIYPEPARDLVRHQVEYGDTSVLDTPTFFHGIRAGEVIDVEIEPGKRLVIKLSAIGEPGADGSRVVFFELNGVPREIRVADRSVTSATKQRPKADRSNPRHVFANMPGMLIKLMVANGQAVEAGEALAVIEAMKMETTLTSSIKAKVAEIHATPGDSVSVGDLLITLE